MTAFPGADAIPPALARLTEWSADLRWEDVPLRVRHRAALVFLDDFAAMVAAREEPELIALRRQIEAHAGPGEATVFDGGARQVDRYSAALANGAAANWCELDGGFRPVVCHAALYCIPAILAEAEATAKRLDEMLLALLAGYETVARIASGFAFPTLRLHPHGGLATIGAAAAVARLRGLDAEEAAAAVGSAATMVLPGPFGHAVDGALIRNVWPGICAQNGIRAVDWALIGITGTPASLSEVLVDILNARSTPDALTRDLGAEWTIDKGYHKMHACCQYGHSTVEAMLEALRETGPLPAGIVRAIRVETHEKGRKLDNPKPATTLAAKFSTQHIAAATALYGHAGAGAFHADTLTDPDVMRLRGLVSIAAFEPEMPPPNDRPARVTITLEDGRSLTGECLSARGGEDRPFSPEEIVAKARDNLEGAYPGAAAILAPVPAGEVNIPAQDWAGIVKEFSSG